MLVRDGMTIARVAEIASKGAKTRKRSSGVARSRRIATKPSREGRQRQRQLDRERDQEERRESVLRQLAEKVRGRSPRGLLRAQAQRRQEGARRGKPMRQQPVRGVPPAIRREAGVDGVLQPLRLPQRGGRGDGEAIAAHTIRPRRRRQRRLRSIRFAVPGRGPRRRPQAAASAITGSTSAENFVAPPGPGQPRRDRAPAVGCFDPAQQRSSASRKVAVNATSVVARPRVRAPPGHTDRQRRHPGRRLAVARRAAPRSARCQREKREHARPCPLQIAIYRGRYKGRRAGRRRLRSREVRTQTDRDARDRRVDRAPGLVLDGVRTGRAIRCPPRCAGARRPWRRKPTRCPNTDERHRDDGGERGDAERHHRARAARPFGDLHVAAGPEPARCSSVRCCRMSAPRIVARLATDRSVAVSKKRRGKPLIAKVAARAMGQATANRS